MNLKMCKYSLLMSAIAVASAFAETPVDSVVQKQESFLDKLTDIERNALGFSINGNVKAGYLRSSIDSDDLWKESQSAEAQAYTRAKLLFTIRPSSETVATFGLRAQKDWNNAHREGNNPPLIDWWAYDGTILNKHVAFNLGTMRVGYSPLTIYQPVDETIMEPEILRKHREEIMDERYLDGSNNRLMQGVNVDFHSFQLGFLDDLNVRGTLARLRNNGKKADQLFFDFDKSDRYAAAGALGVTVSGINVGFTDAYAFDRVRSTRSILTGEKYPLEYEKNNVMSANIGFDSKALNSHSALSFGANAEFALSSWHYYQDRKDSVIYKNITVYTDSIFLADGTKVPKAYLTYKDSVATEATIHDLARLDNQLGVYANAFLNYDASKWSVKAKGNFVKTDKGYQAELAMSPVSMGLTSILNSNAAYDASDDVMPFLLENARSGALENMYFSFYEAIPLTAYNMMLDPTSCKVVVDGSEKLCVQSDEFELFNNYKYGQFYRNGYSHKTMKRAELLSMASALNPAGNLALPYGYATPNRMGGDIDVSFDWDDAINVRVLAGYYSADEIKENDSTYFASGESYLRLGGGLSVKFGNLFALSRTLDVSASYEQTKEDGYLDRTSSSIVAGFNADIYGPVALLGGFHYLKSEFGKSYAGVLDEISEMLVIGGPRLKIAAGAYLSVQYGFMTNSLAYNAIVDGVKVSKDLDITKNIIMADVKVDF